MTDELIGKQVGGYEILEQIGRGGMATVYRARQTSMNRIVALKVLPRHFMRDDTYLQRFEREVKIASQLEHRSIIPVYDYGEYDGQPFIAMRYMPAGSVDDLINGGPMMMEAILKVIDQIAPALDYAHSKSVLHRDLKPSNILMDENGDAYVTDFGIARVVSEAPGNTITTQGVVGTPSYMSPEQAQGQALDGRSDVYSLGIMLFEMATGRRPFENETPYGIAVMQVTTQPPNPRTINPSISGAVEQVILKALKKKPENRYQTAVQLAESLRMAIERPGSMHDTQPRGLPVQSMMESTQPSQTYPNATPPPMQTGQPMPQQYAPGMTPPPSQTHPPMGFRAQARRPKQGTKFWRNMIIGSFIGCGLLSAVVFVMLMALGEVLNDESTVTMTPTRETTPVGAVGTESAELTPSLTPLVRPTGSLEPLDPTSAAARENLLDLNVRPQFSAATLVATPLLDSEVLPAGVRPTEPFPSNFAQSQPHMIVYFAKKEESFDIFAYDLLTGETLQLTDDKATSSYPVISPDSQYMAYQSSRDSDFDIYVMNLNTGSTTRLTENTVIDRLPAWSPDGAWIVYSSDTRGDGNYDIFRVLATGGEPELLISNGLRNSHARYSADGTRLVFTTGISADAATWEVAVYEFSTGRITVLTDNEVRDASPSFSPDNETILYITEIDGRTGIATLNADGDSAPDILYDDSGYTGGAYYSPDGMYIIFNSEVGVNSTIYIMRSDGSDLYRVENSGGAYPSWIPYK